MFAKLLIPMAFLLAATPALAQDVAQSAKITLSNFKFTPVNVYGPSSMSYGPSQARAYLPPETGGLFADDLFNPDPSVSVNFTASNGAYTREGNVRTLDIFTSAEDVAARAQASLASNRGDYKFFDYDEDLAITLTPNSAIKLEFDYRFETKVDFTDLAAALKQALPGVTYLTGTSEAGFYFSAAGFELLRDLSSWPAYPYFFDTASQSVNLLSGTGTDSALKVWEDHMTLVIYNNSDFEKTGSLSLRMDVTTAVAVPEASSAAMMLLGIAALMRVASARRRQLR